MKDMSFIALSNSTVVDKVYGQPANNWADLAESVNRLGLVSPYSTGVFKGSNTPNIPAIISPQPLVSGDQGTTITIPIMSPLLDEQYLAGVIISERYVNFAQGKEHKVELIFSESLVTAPINITQEYIITPMGGVDTTTEYTLFTIVPDLIYPTANLNAAGILVNAPPRSGAKGFLFPWQFTAGRVMAIVFRGVGTQAQVDITVTPIWVHSDTRKTLSDILNG